MGRQEIFRKRLREVIHHLFGGNAKLAADEIGFSQPTLHKILSGKTKESKDSTLVLLADRLGVSTAWLRGDSDTPGASRSLPTALALLFLYYERRQRAPREWVSNFKPRSSYGRALKAAVERDIR